MKFTISDCISRINQALNYPAISYEDVSHFFDQAIAELNTSLRIALPTVSEMRDAHTFKISESPNTVILTTRPTPATVIQTSSTRPTADTPVSEIPVIYYVNPDRWLDNALYIYKNGWKEVDEVFGIVSGDEMYTLIPVLGSGAVWKSVSSELVKEFSLTEYLPTDWIILFLIPYVCFKFAVRNGDNGALFSDEFTQGFQQLQTSYNVPNRVTLSEVAHLPAYRAEVQANINNLRIQVPLHAITEGMRIRNSIKAIYGAGLFENGGWGI